MTFSAQLVACYPGPSKWCRKPVCEYELSPDSRTTDAGMSLQELAEAASLTLQDLPDLSRVEPLPSLIATDLTTIADLIAKIAIDVQRATGFAVSFYGTSSQPGCERNAFAVEAGDRLICELAVDLAIALIDPILRGGKLSQAPIDRWRRFNALASRRLPDLPAAAIIKASIARGIPVQTLDPQHRIFDLGNGAWRRRLLSSIPETTSFLAERIAIDKSLTNHYLRHAGLPVPDGIVVHSADQACRAAAEIGFPVVLKPVDGGGSVGVTVNIDANEQVRAKFPSALKSSQSGAVLVERHIEGRRYRAVVINKKLNSVIEHLKASVVGDGEHSVRELIDIANADPRRGTRLSSALTPITIDDALLRELESQRLALDDIPPGGKLVVLKPRARRGDGGYSIDRTDLVHPDNAAILVHACQAIRLDVGTIDLIAPDIGQSIWSTGGAIVDINTGSGFNSELNPAEGHPRDPGPAIVDMLFLPGQPVRVPIVAVMGSGAANLCELLARHCFDSGKTVGLATENRLAIGSTELKGNTRRGASGVRTILNHPAVDIAVAEVTAESLIEEGLGFDYCDVAVILSCSGLQTPFGQPIESVLTGLLDADGTLIVAATDTRCGLLSDYSIARRVIINPDPEATQIEQIVTVVEQHFRSDRRPG